MPKPVHGDPYRDTIGEELIKSMVEFQESGFLTNQSYANLKRMSETAKILAAKCDTWALTVLEKKIGGHKGGAHKQTR